MISALGSIFYEGQDKQKQAQRKMRRNDKVLEDITNGASGHVQTLNYNYPIPKYS